MGLCYDFLFREYRIIRTLVCFRSINHCIAEDQDYAPSEGIDNSLKTDYISLFLCFFFISHFEVAVDVEVEFTSRGHMLKLAKLTILDTGCRIKVT